MQKSFCFTLAVVLTVLFSTSAISQIRQTKLYIDNGSGGFTILTATGAGGTLNLPSSGTVASTNTVWSLTGNSGTTVGTDFIGTTDNVNLEFKVNGQKSGIIDQTNFNTSLGYGALSSNTPGLGLGGNNTAIGYYAGVQLTTAMFNTVVGENALYSIKDNTSNSNTAIGALAMQLAANGSANNTALGTGALANAGTYTHCTALGDNANVTGGGSYTDATAIGYNAAATASFTMQLGDANVTLVNTSGGITAGGTVTASQAMVHNYRVDASGTATLGLNATDYIVNVTNATTTGVTMPTAVANGQVIIVYNNTASTFSTGTASAHVTAGSAWMMVWDNANTTWVHLPLN